MVGLIWGFVEPLFPLVGGADMQAPLGGPGMACRSWVHDGSVSSVQLHFVGLKMTSSTPVQSGKSGADQRTSTLVHRLSDVKPVELAASEQRQSNGPSVKAAAKLEGAKRVVSAAQQGVARADEAKLEALRAAIAAGTFKVNPAELAERMLSDALDG